MCLINIISILISYSVVGHTLPSSSRHSEFWHLCSRETNYTFSSQLLLISTNITDDFRWIGLTFVLPHQSSTLFLSRYHHVCVRCFYVARVWLRQSECVSCIFGSSQNTNFSLFSSCFSRYSIAAIDKDNVVRPNSESMFFARENEMKWIWK